MARDLTKKNTTEIVDPQAQQIVNFLEQIGLPADNIIATQSERQIIGQNLPGYIESLPETIKSGARYLSKFVVGAGFRGLSSASVEFTCSHPKTGAYARR